MIIDVQWHDADHKTLEITCRGQYWRWYQFDRAIYEAFVSISTSPHAVVTVLNLLDMKPIPDSAIRQIERIFRKAPPNIAQLVIASTNEAVEWYFAVALQDGVIVVDSVDNLFK